ncbi:sugar efflux transporter [Sesbania bispinosa]|nr:sugar efflux transporter [Sesbania bispinosa]
MSSFVLLLRPRVHSFCFNLQRVFVPFRVRSVSSWCCWFVLRVRSASTRVRSALPLLLRVRSLPPPVRSVATVPFSVPSVFVQLLRSMVSIRVPSVCSFCSARLQQEGMVAPMCVCSAVNWTYNWLSCSILTLSSSMTWSPRSLIGCSQLKQ